jgi:hypothetical protein
MNSWYDIKLLDKNGISLLFKISAKESDLYEKNEVIESSNIVEEVLLKEKMPNKKLILGGFS